MHAVLARFWRRARRVWVIRKLCIEYSCRLSHSPKSRVGNRRHVNSRLRHVSVMCTGPNLQSTCHDRQSRGRAMKDAKFGVAEI